jgi:hypothetical protein
MSACVSLSLEYTDAFFLGRAIGRVMCLSDVFLPNTENLYFFSLLKNDTKTRAQNQTCAIILLDVPIMCVCACVVRARLCEETARVVSFKSNTGV